MEIAVRTAQTPASGFWTGWSQNLRATARISSSELTANLGTDGQDADDTSPLAGSPTESTAIALGVGESRFQREERGAGRVTERKGSAFRTQEASENPDAGLAHVRRNISGSQKRAWAITKKYEFGL